MKRTGRSLARTLASAAIIIAASIGALAQPSDGGPELPQTDQPDVQISVQAPRAGIIPPREVVEQMPLLGYVFFEEDGPELPSRYNRLSPDEAQHFSEHWLQKEEGGESGPGRRSEPMGRSAKQMSLYHNTLNVIGNRMVRAKKSRITLVGAAPDPSRALAMADTVRRYLTTTFGIDSARITLRGQMRPPHASGTRATPADDLPLVAEENLRVEILSDDMELMKPVAMCTLEQVPYDADLVVTAKSAAEVDDWIVTIDGEGYHRVFGPFFYPKQRISAVQILGGRPDGTFRALITLRMRNGEVISRGATFELKRNDLPPASSNRYSILFEFDESKSVEMYAKFLRTEVAPKIPNGATVFIHGHTDVVGEEGHNIELSAVRAGMTERILQEEVRALGRSVVFESYGFGEDEIHAPFVNRLPEGRYYNRTVMIEIAPGP